MSRISYAKIATLLKQELHLPSVPVALAYLAEPPTDIPTWSGPIVPSGCTFWRRAERSVFFATAEQHMNCPIGAVTSGFRLTESAKEDLASLSKQMLACDYLAPEEPEQLPKVPGQPTGVLYGPLAEFPRTPDLILLWVNARAAMLLMECLGNVRWDREAGAGLLFGRPSCAALPMALEGARSVFSVGCAGMRTFTGVADNHLLAVLALPDPPRSPRPSKGP